MEKQEIKNKEFDYNDETSWRLAYNSDEKYFRLDYGKGYFKIWKEKDFMEHIKLLLSIN